MAIKKTIRPITVGTNLRRIRQQVGLTQQALADRAGLNRATIIGLESGRRANPEVQTIEALARGLGVKPSDLTAGLVFDTPMEPLLRDFLASPHAAVVEPTEEEIAWLRSLPGLMWIDCVPSLKTFALMIEAYRSRQQ